MSNQAYISLGGNVGNTQEIFEQALQMLAENVGKITQKSSLYQTAAWGNIPQNDFLNQVIKLETSFDASTLLDSLLTIELYFKRDRKEKWGPRTLDLDLLYFNQALIDTVDLQVPHPRIKARNFILIPLAEIAPQWIDPKEQQSILHLKETCKDELPVIKITS